MKRKRPPERNGRTYEGNDGKRETTKMTGGATFVIVQEA